MRSIAGSVAVPIAATLVAGAPAEASYGSRSAPLVWEQQAVSNGNEPPGGQSAAILHAGGTLSSCDSASGDQLCLFGRPELSPDARTIIVSRHPRRLATRSPVRAQARWWCSELMEAIRARWRR
jgi:hypothetical protein